MQKAGLSVQVVFYFFFPSVGLVQVHLGWHLRGFMRVILMLFIIYLYLCSVI